MHWQSAEAWVSKPREKAARMTGINGRCFMLGRE
jgi:hypothetical protein